MYRLFFIAKNNMKKQKSDMITFLLLTFLSSFLLFDCISAVTGTGKVLDDLFEEINGAHVMLYVKDNDAEVNTAENVFSENERIAEYEKTPLLDLTVKFRKKGEREFNSYEFFIEALDEEKHIMNLKKPDMVFGKYDILIPYNLKIRFALGDILQLKIEEDIYDLRVVGYLEDPYYASTTNISVYNLCVDRELMEEIADEHKDRVLHKYVYKGRVLESELQGKDTLDDLEKEIEDAYKNGLQKYEGEDHSSYMLINWDMMKIGAEYPPLLVIAMILIFALLVLLIAIVIIAFSIKNFINKNMKSTGILEACGYTVGELQMALILQISSITLTGSTVGVVLGLLTFRSFGDIISLVMGLSWNQPANYAIAFGTVFGIVILIAMVCRIAGAAYKRISTLDALRGGVTTHSFRKNPFPFESTPFPLPLTLALKETFGSPGRNLAMVFIIALLVIATLVGFGIYDNFGTDARKIMEILSIEVGTASVECVSGRIDHGEMITELKNIEGVEAVLACTNFTTIAVKGEREKNVTTMIYNDMSVPKSTHILEGRLPKTDNEVMITTGVAKDLDLNVGDVLEIKYGDNSADYMIVGINQMMSNMGRMMHLTIEGAEKIYPGGRIYPTYSIYAYEGFPYAELEQDIYEMADERGYDLEVIDLQGFVTGAVSSVILSMKAICIIIVFITSFVVIFVEALVIRARISRDWHSMGVSKALGQTSTGLIVQIMLSNLPAVLLGTVIGVLLSPKMGKVFCGLIFSIFEIHDLDFAISPIWMLLTAAGILLLAVVTAGIEGLKVKRIQPVDMLAEE